MAKKKSTKKKSTKKKSTKKKSTKKKSALTTTNKMTTNFYKLQLADNADPHKIFEYLESLATANRNQELKGDTLRLQQMSIGNEFTSGEFAYLQRKRNPQKGGLDGTMKSLRLGPKHSVAYSTAFTYHRPTHTIALEHNFRGATKTSIQAYLAGFSTQPIEFLEVIRGECLDRILNMARYRKLEVKIAMPLIDSALRKSAGVIGMAKAASHFESETVEIKLTSSKKEETLSRAAVKKFLNTVKTKNHGVAKLKVSGYDDEEGGTVEAVDFFIDRLRDVHSVQLPVDMHGTYQLRANAVQAAWDRNKAELLNFVKPIE